MAQSIDLQKTYNLLFEQTKKAPSSGIAELNKARNIATLLGDDYSKSYIPNPLKLDSLKKYLGVYSPDKYMEFFGEQPNAEGVNLDDETRNAFAKANDRYKYFAKEGAPEYENFARIYKLFKHRQIIEPGLTDDLVIDAAYKTIIFFGDKKNQLSSLSSFIKANLDTATAIHDIAIKSIVTCSEYGQVPYSLKNWQGLIEPAIGSGTGMILLDAFQNADAVENALKASGSEFPKNTKELLTIISQLKYTRAAENPELAQVFSQYQISNARFENAINFLQDFSKKKEEENIPTVIVKASSNGEIQSVAKGPGYYIVKLPSNDPRALILGDITGCCQSFDGNSARCVGDGILLPNNGFYLFLETKREFDPQNIDWANLEKSAKIVGQAYVWRSQSNNVVLDSLEISGNMRSSIPFDSMLHKLGEELITEDPTISRVLVGRGGGTSLLNLSRYNDQEYVTWIDKMKTGHQYIDSFTQTELYASPSLQNLRNEAEALLGKQVMLSSERELEILKKSTPDSIEQLKNANQIGVRLYIADSYNVDISKVVNIREESFEMLTEPRIIEVVTQGLLSFEQINQIKKPDTLDIILSPTAIECYKIPGGPTFEQINQIENKYKMRVLTSQNAIDCYKIPGMPTFDQLNELEVDKASHLINGMSMLTNSQAKACYQEEFTTYDKLKKFEDDDSKIYALTGENAQECYRKGYIQFDELQSIQDPTKIHVLTSKDAQECYSMELAKFDELKDMDSSLIRVLTSVDVRESCKQGLVTFDELKTINEFEIYTLTSQRLRECCSKGFIKLDEFKQLENNKRILLTSKKAIECYEIKGMPTFDQMKNLPYYKIEDLIEGRDTLTRGGVKSLYQQKLTTYEELSKFDEPKIWALSSFPELYEKGLVNFHEVKLFDAEKIRRLKSSDAYTCYESKLVSFDQLKDLDAEKIEVLTSRDAQFSYQYVSFDKLKDLSVEQIKDLTSNEAREKYQAGKTFDQLFKEKYGDSLPVKVVAGIKDIVKDLTQQQHIPSAGKEYEKSPTRPPELPRH